MAGHGRINVDIRGELTRPLVEIAERCEGLHTVTFVPQECCLHSIVITMNGVPVPGEISTTTYGPSPLLRFVVKQIHNKLDRWRLSIKE